MPSSRPLYADLLGGEVSLAAVYDLARRITAKYGAAGYVLSRAIVPPQNFGRRGAVIRIQVVEGYVDQVIWPVEKLTRYRDFFTDYSARITADRPANVRTLERYLLLANDLPGLKFSTTLKPSPTHPNASILIVEVKEKMIDTIARIDNRGTRARGPWQYLGSATFNNIAGSHEAFTATYAGTFQLEELQYIQAAYRQVLNSEGLTFFANASYAIGRPGTELLRSLDYRTRSGIAEAGLAYPVIRTRELNLILSGLGFITDDQSASARPAVHARQAARLPPQGRCRLGRQLPRHQSGQCHVQPGHQGPRLERQRRSGRRCRRQASPIPSTNAGRVDFSKIEATFSRLQPLLPNFSAFVAAYGQYAFTPLLVSEQCSYGGRFFGRAFDPSQMLGDHCWAVLGELRYDIVTPWKQLTRLQAYAYADHGEIHNIKPAAGTPLSQSGTSVGARRARRMGRHLHG